MEPAKPKLKAGGVTDAEAQIRDGHTGQLAAVSGPGGTQGASVATVAPLPGEQYGLSVKYFRWGIQQRGYTRLGWRRW